jgi:hypothetical protein
LGLQFLNHPTAPAAAIDSLHAGDLELLAKHGLAGLQAIGFAGVIDRLQRNGKI